jgi:hypothetical protein
MALALSVCWKRTAAILSIVTPMKIWSIQNEFGIAHGFSRIETDER